MAFGLNVNNPQTQVSSVPVTTGFGVSYAGDATGPGANTTTSSSALAASQPATSSTSISTILIYGAIALVVIFILKKL